MVKFVSIKFWEILFVTVSYAGLLKTLALNISVVPSKLININVDETAVIACQLDDRISNTVSFNVTVDSGTRKPLTYKVIPSTVFSIVQLDPHDEPGTYIITCTAFDDGDRYNNGTVSVTVEIKDVCGTPPRRYDVEHGCPMGFLPAKCRIHPPEKFEMIDTVDANGNITVRLIWHEFQDSIYEDKHLYGFRLTTPGSFGSPDSEFCLVTKYQKEGVSNGSGLVRYRGNGEYETTMEAFGWTSEETGYTYHEVSIESLPKSTVIKKTLVQRKKQELCQEYVNAHNGTVPKFCFIFGNISIQLISYDKAKDRVVLQLNWKTKNISWPELNLNTTHIFIYVFGSKYLKATLKTDVTSIQFEFPRVPREFIDLERRNTDGKRLYRDFLEVNVSEILNTNKESPSVIIVNEKSFLPAGVVLGGVALTAFLMIFIIQLWYKRVKKDIHSLLRINAKTNVEMHGLVADVMEDVNDENSPTVMLVYPHGCKEVENMVIFLGSQLHTFGVKVLCDHLQQVRVANEGLPNVLLDNFNKADYVIVLCLETKEDDKSFSSHQPYMFVKKQLISNSCVYNNDDRSHNRYLAVYFDKNKAHVPPYLTPRAYFLPLQFSSFIQNIFGIQTYFSYLYNKIFEQNVPQLVERKKQLQQFADRLKESEHKLCFSTTCHKGQRCENIETTFCDDREDAMRKDSNQVKSLITLFTDDSDDESNGDETERKADNNHNKHMEYV